MALDIVSAQSQLQSPILKALEGYQQGQQIAQEKAAMQQQQQRQQAIREGLSELHGRENLSGSDYARFVTQFPELSEQLKGPMESMDKSYRQAKQSEAASVYAAIESGRPEIARDILSRGLEAAENSSNQQEAAGYRAQLQLLDMDPKAVRSSAGLMLAASMGEDEFADVMGKLRPEQDTPGSYDEFMLAKQDGFQGSYNDFLNEPHQSRGTKITLNTGPDGVDYGPAEKGYAWARDESGKVVTEPDEQGRMRPVQVPISGGSIERQLSEAAEKSTGRKASKARAAGTVVQDLGRALERLPEISQGTGVIGANSRLALEKVAGTTEYDIRQFIESAKSNIGIDVLRDMRETSPTGGALGQVPVEQQKRLEQVLGSMHLGMMPQDLQDNMKRVMNIYRDIVYGSADERAALIEDGKLTPEENEQIQSEYFELSFDEMGRTVDGGEIQSLIDQYAD